MLENNTDNCNSIETASPDEKEVVMAFIFLEDGIPYLKRAADEDLEPGKWGVPAGHVEKTDASPLAAMIREVSEETRLKIDPNTAIKLDAYRTVAKGPDGAIKEKLFAHAFLVMLPQYSLKNVIINPESHMGKMVLHMSDIKACYTQITKPLLRDASKTTLNIEELTTPDTDLIRVCFPAVKEIITKMELTLTAFVFANAKEFNISKKDKSRAF